MVATKWVDRRPIYFLSSIHQAEESHLSITRRGPGGEPQELPCPPVVKEYNRWMGGVDLNDQMAHIDRSRRSYSWYLYLINLQ